MDHMCIYEYIYILYINICVYTSINLYIYIYEHICIYMYVCMFKYRSKYIYTCIENKYIHVYNYLYI